MLPKYTQSSSYAGVMIGRPSTSDQTSVQTYSNQLKLNKYWRKISHVNGSWNGSDCSITLDPFTFSQDGPLQICDYIPCLYFSSHPLRNGLVGAQVLKQSCINHDYSILRPTFPNLLLIIPIATSSTSQHVHAQLE